MEERIVNALAERGLTLSELKKFVPNLAPHEGLCFVGSIAEALGTKESDLDLLLLSDRETLSSKLVFESSNWEQHVDHDAAGREINVELWKFNDLQAIAEDFAMLMANSELLNGRVKHISNIVDLRMLHRVRCGIPVANEEVVFEWRRRLQSELLPNYLMLLGLFFHDNYREDVLAEAEHGRPDSAVWMGQLALRWLLSAILADVGETNPTEKWQFALLDRNRSRIGVDRFRQISELFSYPYGSGPSAEWVRKFLALSDEVRDDLLGRHRVLRRPILVLRAAIRLKSK
jgi:hypothetical protein